jgi:hypothetical protein
MSVTKLIRDRTAILEELEKRFQQTPSGANFQSQIDAVNDQQEARIEARITGLETEKAAAVARYDSALKTERDALLEIRKRRINPGADTDRPTRDTNRTTRRDSAPQAQKKPKSGGAGKKTGRTAKKT